MAVEPAMEDTDIHWRCGTPGHVAPEVILGLAGSSKVDLFGAGVILYLALSSHLPFGNGGDWMGHTVHHELNLDDDVKFAGVGLGPRLLMRSLLEKDPYQRISAADAVRSRWLMDSTGLEAKSASLQRFFSFDCDIRAAVEVEGANGRNMRNEVEVDDGTSNKNNSMFRQGRPPKVKESAGRRSIAATGRCALAAVSRYLPSFRRSRTSVRKADLDADFDGVVLRGSPFKEAD
ncbi:unnamed protein product [Polarella glacialis]|uniref:Protein kinase domain-containing protein n=1 Tax=Polarella glacialis TaxID=89957 RepID=A0A813I326_POLGL|nr:unnamed protein product [Polarella glacialis]CAE8644379.1 unnamed protein product [Polarella glacialis]